MDILNYTFKTYGGHAINDTTNYISKGVPVGSPVLAKSNPVYSERVDEFPVDGGVTLTGRNLPINITVKGGSLSELTKWFDTSDSSTYQLVVTDDGAVDWYVYARAVDFSMVAVSEKPTVKVILFIADPVWKAVTATTDSWDITASGQTRNLTVGGNKFARPVFTVGPTSARTGGFGYKRFVALANRVPRIYSDAINLPDSDWDTAALTTAKMQAGGEDCRVYNDEVNQEEYRWFGGGGIDSATTRVFCNVTLPPMISFTLSGAIADSGAISSISVKVTAANLAALKELAKLQYKFIAVEMGTADIEIFSFTGVTIGKTAYTITGTTRAQKGTTAHAHADGDTFYAIKGYYIMYGNASLSAPSTDDTFKPMLDLTNSTNASHVWADFYDALYPNRTCQWRPQIIKNVGEESEIYTATENAFADTASVMGGAIKVYSVGTAVRAPTASLAWSLYHPGGITTLTWSGKKYRYLASWSKVMAMQKSNDGKKFTTIANEATPSAAATWEALSAHSAVSLSGTFLYIRQLSEGTVAAIADNMAAIETADVTAALDTTKTPLIYFGAEETNNYEEFRITNTVASVVQWWIEVNQQIPVDTTITINTDTMEAYMADGTPIKVTLDDESRAEWCPLTPGATNVLTYTETGANTVTLGTSFHNRNL